MMRKTVISALLLASAFYSSTSAAGAYLVEQHLTDESYWTVSYYDDLSENQGEFSVVHDEVEQEITLSFTSADGLASESCMMTPEAHEWVYNFTVELAENVSRVDSFTVYPGDGDICPIIDDIVYREDVVEFEFNCEEGYTQFGQSVYVVGSTPLLGSWDPAKAIKLDPVYYPHWQGNITVELDQDIEWKCIVRDELDASNVIMWEQGDNNSFNSNEVPYQWGRFIFQ